MANKNTGRVINDQTFDQMVAEIYDLTKKYDDYQLKHLPYVDAVSKVYERHGVSKEEFSRELEKRLNKPSAIRVLKK